MEQILGQFLGDLIQGVLSILLQGALVYGLYKGTAFLRLKVANIKDEQLQNVITNSLNRLEDMVEKGVKATEVSVGASLREAVKDCKVDKSELYALKDVVRNEVLEGLSEDFKTNIELGVGDLNVYINQLIEIKLDEIKKQII